MERSASRGTSAKVLTLRVPGLAKPRPLNSFSPLPLPAPTPRRENELLTLVIRPKTLGCQPFRRLVSNSFTRFSRRADPHPQPKTSWHNVIAGSLVIANPITRIITQAADSHSRLLVKKWIAIAGLLVLLVAAITYRAAGDKKPQVNGSVWQPLEFGTITESVSATGTLQPRDTVAVGTEQVGRIVDVSVDIGHVIERDQPLLRLDDQLAKLRVGQAEAAIDLARAEVQRVEVGRDAAQTALSRAKELAEKGGPQRDVDTAEAALKNASAAVGVAQARVREAEAALKLAEHGVAVTIVRSPLAGVVIDKRVTAGQIIGPPQSALLFTVAADLARMELIAQVAEADIGRIQPGLPVTFTVNAFPDFEFTGKVTQIRPVPVTLQTAVFYAVAVDCENAKDPTSGEWRLRPGMPAAVECRIRRHEDVWKLPAASRGATLDPELWREADRAKLQRWESRSDRSDWQPIWLRDGEGPPRLTFLRLSGQGSHGETGIQDGQFVEVLAWDPDETPPNPKKPSRALISSTGPDKPAPGIRLF